MAAKTLGIAMPSLSMRAVVTVPTLSIVNKVACRSTTHSLPGLV